METAPNRLHLNSTEKRTQYELYGEKIINFLENTEEVFSINELLTELVKREILPSDADYGMLDSTIKSIDTRVPRKTRKYRNSIKIDSPVSGKINVVVVIANSTVLDQALQLKAQKLLKKRLINFHAENQRDERLERVFIQLIQLPDQPYTCREIYEYLRSMGFGHPQKLKTYLTEESLRENPYLTIMTIEEKRVWETEKEAEKTQLIILRQILIDKQFIGIKIPLTATALSQKYAIISNTLGAKFIKQHVLTPEFLETYYIHSHIHGRDNYTPNLETIEEAVGTTIKS